MNNMGYTDLMLNQTKDLIWMVDHQFYLVYANKAYFDLMKEVTGVELELNASVLFDGFGKEHEEKWKSYYQRGLSGDFFTIEEHFFHPGENKMKYGHISFSPIKDEDGKVNCVACRNTDVTSIVKEKYQASSLMNTSLDIFRTIEDEQQLHLLSSVIINTNDAVLITEAEPLDEPGPRIIYVNEAFTKMTGYSPEEVIGKTPRILQGPKSDKVALANLGKALRNWEPYEITTINYKKNGEEFWINFTVTPVADETGRYTHWIAIERDVSEQKNTELEKDLLAEIAASFREKDLNQAGKVLCEIIRDFADFELVELWCPNMERTEMSRIAFDTTLETFHLENDALSHIPITKGLLGKVWKQKKQLLWNHTQIAKNFARKVEAQKEGIKHILGVPLVHQNEINGILVIATRNDAAELAKLSDIIKNLETFIGSEINRKRLEDDLKHLYEAIPEILCITDMEGRTLEMNPAGFELLGYKKDEILMKPFDMFVHPDDKIISFQELEKLKKGVSTFQFENRCITKSGGVVWLSWNCNVSLQDGLIYAAAKDITKEKELWQLNKQAYNLAKVGSWEYDMVEDILFWSDEVFHLHDMNPDTFVPNVETAIDFYKEEHKSYVAAEIYKSLSEGVHLDYEAIIVSKNKKEKWVRVIASPVFVEGKCIKFIGSFQDTTDRKEAENRLQSLSDNIPGVVFIYQLHPNGSDEFKYVSKGSEKICGYSPEEISQNIDLVWDLVKAGGDFETLKQSINDSVENKSQWYMRFRIVRPDGEKRLLQGLGTPEFLSNGTVQYNSVVLDITQEAKTQELLDDVVKLTKIGSWEVNLIKNTIFWSDEVHRIYETDPTIFQPAIDKAINFYREDYRDLALSKFEECMKTGESYDIEAVVITATGKERWVRTTAKAEIINGECIRVYGSFQDNHEYKEAEIRLQTLANNLPGVVFQYYIYPNGKDALRAVTKGAQKVWGFAADEVMENNQLVWEQILLGGDIEVFQKSVSDSVANKSKWTAQWKYIMPNGELKIHLGYGSPNYLSDGTVVFNSVILDITTEALNEQLLEQVSKLGKIGGWELNLQTMEPYFSEQTFKIYELPIGTPPKVEDGIQFYAKEVHPIIIKAVTEAIENHIPYTLELPFITAKGNEIWVKTSGQVDVVNGKAIRLYGAIQDITEQKIAEQELKSITERFQIATEAANIGIWDWNIIENKLIWDEKMFEIFNVNPSEFNGAYEAWESTVHPDDIEQVNTDVENAINGVYEFKSTFRIVWKDGSVHYIKANALIERDENGKAIRMVGANWDITKEKIAKKQVLLALQEKNNILESIDDAFFAVDKNGSITYWNKRAENVMGRKREEVINQNLWNVFPDTPDLEFYQQYHTAVNTGERVNFEEFYPPLNIWLDVSAYPSKEGLSVYFKNVTQRKKFEEERNKLQQTLENSLNEIYIFDSESFQFSYINKGALHNLGYSAEEAKELTPLNLQPEYTLNSFRKLINPLLLKEKERIVFFTFYQRKDGSQYPVEAYLQLIEEGTNKNFVAIVLDITERKKNEELLDKSNRLARMGNWEADLIKGTVYWSAVTREIHEADADYVPDLAKGIDFYKEGEDRNRITQLVEKCIESGAPWDEELQIVTLKGNLKWIRTIGEAEFRDGKCIRFYGSFQDITERKKQEKQLSALNESLQNYARELERSNEELEQFAFITSHDLQEPLRMITSFMDQLKRKYADRLDDKGLQYIQYAIDGAKRMRQIILDLLLYSRANRPTDQMEQTNLAQIVNEYAQLRRQLIEQKRGVITFNNLPTLRTFRSPMTQIFHCLLDNALKYVDENKPPNIEISAIEKEDVWQFSIKDNGIGIDQRFFDKIFIIFQRLQNRKEYDGTGIGLAVVKRCVEFLGGEIWVESEVGNGSTFYFTVLKNNKKKN